MGVGIVVCVIVVVVVAWASALVLLPGFIKQHIFLFCHHALITHYLTLSSSQALQELQQTGQETPAMLPTERSQHNLRILKFSSLFKVK